MVQKRKNAEGPANEPQAKKVSLSKADLIEVITNRVKESNTSDSSDSEDDSLTSSEEVQEVGEHASVSVTSSDENESEDSEDGNDQEEDDTGKKSNGSTTNHKNLSSQEVQIARETAELFKSNIFKLQIDELMKEVQLKDTKIAKIEKFLHKLHDIIESIPDLKDQSLEEVEKWVSTKSTAIPFNDPKPANVNYKFSYMKPENIAIVGSFGLKTGIQSSHGLSIDVNLTMPAEIFQAKDYLNYRALHKRAFYLGYLADSLNKAFKSEKLGFLKLSYKYLNDDILTPVLRLEATDINLESEYNFHKTKFSINILAGLPHGIFDSKKLLPNKNCIRVQKESEQLELPSTPLYNASILTMTSYDHYLKFLYKTKKSAEQFKEACILGRLWLSQRGLGASIEKGGFGHFEFATLMAALLNGGGLQGNKILLHGFSSYQLFKGVVKYLASEDLAQEGFVQFYSGSTEATRYIKGGFNTPTLFDKSTKINILHKMSNNSYKLLVHHAKKTLVLLNDVFKDRFDVLFLQNSNQDHLKFDYVVNFQIPLANDEDYQFGPFEKITHLTFENFISNKISFLLQYGLGDRLLGFDICFNRASTFDITSRKPKTSNTINARIGLLINAAESEKLVIKGPAETDEESLQFRAFWGSKSSLRRFKDGSIVHSVVWVSDHKKPIVISAMEYILKRHLKEELEVTSTITEFNKLLPLPNLPSSTQQTTISTVATNSLVKSYDDLHKILIKMELPLNVKSVLPASAGLRSTSLLQPVPFSVSSPDFFNELVVQFESSVKWPDEISALEKVKTAFLLKIHETLAKETVYKSYVVQDQESIPYNFDICTLNVLTPEGYGFKLRVLTERDEVLYLRAIENSSKEKRVAVESIYFKFNQKYLGAVSHTRHITSLSHRFQFFSPTVRLFKKWLDDQLLLSHFNDELVELIALQPFLDPSQYEAPGSIQNGFMKILSFLSSWNWKEDPLILDLAKNQDEEENEIVSKLSDRLTLQTYQQIKSNFQSVRQQDPNGLKIQFFIASKIDQSGKLWSSGVQLPMAARLTALAKVAVQLIKTKGLNSSTIDLLFKPSLSDYDFVLTVKSPFALGAGSGVLTNAGAFKNLIAQNNSYPQDITSRFDPVVKLVQILNSKYKDIILFSSHKYTINEKNHNVITGLFVPSKLAKSKFKVQLGYNCRPHLNDEVILNKDAIFNEILNISGDLASDFDKK
ncbi:hypothetical protein WICPIJ_005000 [Wickerhamomyces pijperi]|uniref:U3 small nucleolar RNA-associated protein 22 n=1 Tax=Wickerhamomyces pijperi TaxID=599730 RepID=A0A9P8Q4E2_WICPI|nr:hypothetical protein WICPIJ_005000 [Wickerhamomyces pijperi]